jgi:hypothetical protein
MTPLTDEHSGFPNNPSNMPNVVCTQYKGAYVAERALAAALHNLRAQFVATGTWKSVGGGAGRAALRLRAVIGLGRRALGLNKAVRPHTRRQNADLSGAITD